MEKDNVSRRAFSKGVGSLGLLAALEGLVPSYARAIGTPFVGLPAPRPTGGPVDLVVADQKINFDGREGRAMTVGGSLPGPIIRLKEGEEAVLRVTNHLKETSSVHWHGVLVPPDMDGVPGVSFAGIKPGETFVYRFPVRQYGTYWYHSHSGGQELLGVYGPLIIDPAGPEPFKVDREYVVMLSDWSFESPERMISNLKALGNYYNRQRRTAGEFFRDASDKGFSVALSDYESWSRMRMDPTDLADVTGETLIYLMNGLSPASNWTGTFQPGERVRLRFINAGASTYFDVRLPGLKLRVVQADGQNVQPVEVDEFRISPAETYDVIVEPRDDKAYTIFAETMDRSGYARGTLAPRAGMAADVPQRRSRPVLSMKDMGMEMAGMEKGSGKDGAPMPGMTMPAPKAAPGGQPEAMPGMAMPAPKATPGGKEDAPMPGMAMPAPKAAPGGQHDGMPGMPGKDLSKSIIPGSVPVPHSEDSHGIGNQTVPMTTQARLGEPGVGLGGDGWRVLVYTDLKRIAAREDKREPGRELELHLTGNMERFMWSFDGKKYSEAKAPIPFRQGERLRLTFVNDTMMAHPLHLHGMWMELENGNGQFIPRKHTVNVKPAERVSVAVTADAPGRWAFHCHLLLHMEVGMFRVVEVSDRPVGEGKR
jgi:CopA family copper-resistance protein